MTGSPPEDERSFLLQRVQPASFARSFVSVTLGGAIIAVLSSALGLAAS